MQAKLRVNYGGKIWVEVDASNVKDAIKAITEYGEVFRDQACGMCGSPDISAEHREHDDNSYYDLRCHACGAQLDFGQHRTGDTLYAKRKNEAGEFDKEHRGWYRYYDRNERSQT